MPPRKPLNTYQVSLRIDETVEARTERVMGALLETQPALRPVLGTLSAQLRVMVDRGLAAYEADLGLQPPDAPSPPQSTGAAPKRARKAGKAAK